jgi:cytochrome c
LGAVGIVELRRFAAALGLATAMVAGAVAAQSPVATGRKIAETLCSRCHAVGTTGASPHGQAPPFREVARRYPPVFLAEALAEGLVTGHKDMPEFTFDPDEIEAFLAYLSSLAPEPR